MHNALDVDADGYAKLSKTITGQFGLYLNPNFESGEYMFYKFYPETSAWNYFLTERLQISK